MMLLMGVFVFAAFFLDYGLLRRLGLSLRLSLPLQYYGILSVYVHDIPVSGRGVIASP